MSSSSSSLGISDIVGIAIGGVLGLVTIIGLIISCYAMCCKKKQAQVWAQPVQQYPPYGGYGQPMNTGYYPQQPPNQQSQQPISNKPLNNNDQPPPPYPSPYPGSNGYGNYNY